MQKSDDMPRNPSMIQTKHQIGVASGIVMARSDLIIDLVKAGVSGDADSVRVTAEAIAADERFKKHTGVADRISKALTVTPKPGANGRMAQPATRLRDGSGGIQRREPDRPMSDLFLEKKIQSACGELIEEQHRADVLRAHGLEPRHRLLLVGPPGNGKTSLAESLAYELALPLFVVRYDAIITSYLGDTSTRLRRMFDFVRTEPCVLFFDEFDALGKERGDLHETGEIKRVVATLLMQLDDLPSYCVLGPVEIHRVRIIVAPMWIMASKLVSVLQARIAIRLNSLSF